MAASNGHSAPPLASTSKLFDGLKPELPTVPGADPSLIALDAFRVAAAVHVSETLGVDVAQAFAGIEDGKKGQDLQLAVARFRLPGKNAAAEAAKKIAEALQPNDYLSSCLPDGNFLYFSVNRTTLARVVLNQINALTHLAPTPSYGTNRSGEGKKAIIEYSSPNIAKPFHAGHLRSTIIGQFLVNLYRACGWEVTSWNYLGDWGKQFGILTVGYDKYGDEEKLANDAITHLYDVYVAINRDAEAEVLALVKEARAKEGRADDPAEPTKPELDAANAQAPIHSAARAFFRQMEDDDEAALARWRKFRDLSIVKYREVYGRLNIAFDVYGGESQVSQESMDMIDKKLTDGSLSQEDKGAMIIDLEKWKLGKTIVRKRDGTALYITRDIAGAVERYDAYKFDKLVYVVASQQDLHFKQLFKVLDLMGYEWAKSLEHITFGMVKGMSTRRGTAVFLEQILNTAGEEMHDQMRRNPDKYAQIDDPVATSDNVGISAVKIQDMAGKRINGYEFNWDRMLSFEGDTGPYLQYAHTRLCSIQRKAADTVSLPAAADVERLIDTGLLAESKAHELILILAQYPDAVRNAMFKSEPSTIVSYCWKLSHAVSSAYEVLLVKGADQPVAEARLFLYQMSRDVLGSAMRLLSLAPLERM